MKKGARSWGSKWVLEESGNQEKRFFLRPSDGLVNKTKHDKPRLKKKGNKYAIMDKLCHWG